MRKLVFLVILFVVCCCVAQSQEQSRFDDLEDHTGLWIGLGIGSSYFGIAKSGGISFSLSEHVISARYSQSAEFQFNVDGDYETPARGMKEISFAYGQYLKKGNTAVVFSLGISFLNGVRRGQIIQGKEFQAIRISTVGLPLGADLMIGISENVGLGLNIYGNINKDKSFMAVNAKLNLGTF